jgi:DNA-binding transcriptional LysR family regulator
VDIRDLAYFETIARLGSLRRAAEVLGRTKPALSKCLRRLEESVNAPLFERFGRRLLLTEPGRVLAEHAAHLRVSMADAIRHVAEQASGQRGHVRIGLGTSISEALLPVVAKWLAGEPPGVMLEVRLGLNDALRRDLADDKLDIIVTTAQADDGSTVAREEWLADEMVVVGRAGHPLDRDGPVSMEEMLGFGWVLTGEGTASRQWLDWAFASRGLGKPKVRVEIDSAQMMSTFVGSTNLLSFAPRRTLGGGRLGAGLVELRNDGTTMQRSLCFLHRRNGYVSAASRRLTAALRTAMKGSTAPGCANGAPQASGQDGRKPRHPRKPPSGRQA